MAALRHALAQLGEGRDLSAEDVHAAVSEIMGGDGPEAPVAAFLTALRVKGETADELTGAVRAVRDRMIPFEGAPPDAFDTCGTGGDGAHTVNVSTAAAIVLAACGVPVVKHGNRAASGNSGSSEVLSELGIAIEADPDTLRRSLSDVGIAFLFAPRFHPALKPLAAIRRQLPFRTLFNLIGPLANPARPNYQLIGVAGDRAADLMARSLVSLGIARAAVVTGEGGLDEVSLSGPTAVRWVEGDRIALSTWQPEDFGLPRGRVEDLQVSGPADSASRLRSLFEGEGGPIRDIVVANVAAALLVAGKAPSLRDGVVLAGRAIDTGEARNRLDRWSRVL